MTEHGGTAAWLRHAERTLADAGVPTPDVDAVLLLGHVTDRRRGEVGVDAVLDRPISAQARARLDELLRRRAAREPLQHLTGRAPFRRLELAVGAGVFVPRPETEQLVGLALEELATVHEPQPIVVDLGTGSGAIALSIALEAPHSRVTALEASAEARVWTQRNLDAAQLPNIRLVAGDMADALADMAGTLSLLVSNPPYVPAEAIPRDIEVRLHDPAQALYSGADGLDHIRIIARRGRTLLRPGGVLLLEHGEHQGADIRAVLADAGWLDAETLPDATGRDRFTRALSPAEASGSAVNTPADA